MLKRRAIKRLSQDIITKIAAGEVIERPAFAVKELIENAIDANATTITIEIEKSGLEKIMVSDDGIGMDKEDLLLCWQPHTTSKIFCSDDLLHITTLGFRGEALASIASISEFSIQSKTTTASNGWSVQIEHGKLVNQMPIGMPTGTKINVNRLFHNVPARHNFLKSTETEFRHITQVVTNQALSHPHITFSLTHNKKNVFSTFAHITVQERIAHLLGLKPEQLVPIHFNQSPYILEGFITKPQFSTTVQTKYYLFVNTRNVRSKRIAQTIRSTYGTLLPRTHYPQFILFLSVPVEGVNVNVHPRKEEVQLIDEEILCQLINTTISQALQQKNLTFYDARWQKNSQPQIDFISPRYGETNTFGAAILKNSLQTKNAEVMQFANLYLIEESSEDLVITDQHAAHERILYEQLMSSWTQQKKLTESLTLSQPIQISLSISELEVVKEYQSFLKKHGFYLELNQNTTITVTAIPILLKDRNAIEVLHELIAELEDQTVMKPLDTKTHQMLIYIACRASIKRGQPLSLVERKILLDQLLQTPHNATCPHGRPTQVRINKNYLHQLFKR